MIANNPVETLVDDFLAKMSEHCDAVQVLASRYEDKESSSIARGTGNWYARSGLVHEFIEMEKARLMKSASEDKP